MSPSERALRLQAKAVGRPPGTLGIPPGALPCAINLIRYDRDHCDVRKGVPVGALAGLLDEHSGFAWVDVNGVGDQAVLETLIAEFGIPWLALEDILHSPQRPKVDPYDDARFIIVRMLDRPGSCDMDQFSIFAQDRVVFTFQQRPGDPFDPIRARLADASSQLRQRGVDYLIYRLIDACVDSFFPELERIADELEEVEEEAVKKASAQALKNLHVMRRDLRVLERVALPMRDAVGALARDEEGLFDRQTRPYLRDVQDHTTQVVELINFYSGVTKDISDLVLASLDVRMNQVMRVLAAVTFVFMPLTFVVGIYGMNFTNMPELSTKYGYFAVLGFLAALSVGLIWWLRKRGWTRTDIE